MVAHPDVDGVWAANDEMAMGAIQALKELGKAGQIKVSGTDGIPEIYDAIRQGFACSTVMQDAKYQAELGLAMALAAKQGKLNVTSLPPEKREFMIPGVEVTKANVDQVVNEFVKNTPKYDLTDFWARMVK